MIFTLVKQDESNQMKLKRHKYEVFHLEKRNRMLSIRQKFGNRMRKEDAGYYS